jgi:dihydrofolate reductase
MPRRPCRNAHVETGLPSPTVKLRSEVRPAHRRQEAKDMRSMAAFIITSLDGFYAGPNEEFDWPIVDEDFNDFAVRQLDGAGTLVFGRVTYEHMAAYWPTELAAANDPAITHRMNDKAKLVFSRTLENVGWAGSSLLRGEATQRAAEAKAGEGPELLVIGSPHLTAALVAAGLLDELRIMISPILLGRGRSLFEDLQERICLTLIDVAHFASGNVLLTYRLSR